MLLPVHLQSILITVLFHFIATKLHHTVCTLEHDRRGNLIPYSWATVPCIWLKKKLLRIPFNVSAAFCINIDLLKRITNLGKSSEVLVCEFASMRWTTFQEGKCGEERRDGGSYCNILEPIFSNHNL